MKLLVIGDLHIQITNPVNRTDNIKEAFQDKFNEIKEIIKTHDVAAVICTGDIFNTGQVTNSTLLFAFYLIEQINVPTFTTPGNHDLFNHSIATLDRSSLKVLEKLSSNLFVLTTKDDCHYLSDSSGNRVCLSFQEFSDELDNGVYNGYLGPEKQEGIINIHTVHGMLLDHIPPFDRFTVVSNVTTNADVVVSGHDHLGYGMIKQKTHKFLKIPTMAQ